MRFLNTAKQLRLITTTTVELSKSVIECTDNRVVEGSGQWSFSRNFYLSASRSVSVMDRSNCVTFWSWRKLSSSSPDDRSGCMNALTRAFVANTLFLGSLDQTAQICLPPSKISRDNMSCKGPFWMKTIFDFLLCIIAGKSDLYSCRS